MSESDQAVCIEAPESLERVGSNAVGATLYAHHLVKKMSRFQRILEDTSYDHLIISSGEIKIQFQDDLQYPFKANPYFKEWVPLNKRPGSFLHITSGASKPRLFLLCAEDIWHTAPQALLEGFDHGLDIIEYNTLDDVKIQLKTESAAVAYIGEANPLALPEECLNPSMLLNHIDFQRRYKTMYEQHCVREANRLAIPGHLAAYDTFMGGGSELEICAAYLRACYCSGDDMPYSVIAGLNEHAAILHNYRLDHQAPKDPRSFLLDAGVDVNGYASDITRTYAYDATSEFADMIRMMGHKQQELVAAGALGKCPTELYELSQRKIAEILASFGVITVSIDEAVETRLIETFYPHSLGHHLGCNVHDKGSQLANPQGQLIPRLPDYPKMYNLAPMVASQIHTVEPGLYFIPALLEKLRGTPAETYLNWSRVEHFIPYGGIRIEDNIILHADGRLENLTRQAFSNCL